MKQIACLFFSLAAVSAWAGEPFTAWVVGITDGDTVTVLLRDEKRPIRVRLASIDAPERAQAFGQVCRQSLAEKIFKHDVTVRPVPGTGQDQFGRVVATLEFNGRDINLAQVAEGCAWHYTEYARRNQNAETFTVYATAEHQARATRTGLWTDREPVKPSEFRRGQK
jgi:endonuclease YncB( thermonuclease family)